MFNKLKKQTKESEQWVRIKKPDLIKIMVKTYNEGYNNGKEGKKNIAKEFEAELNKTIKTEGGEK